MEKLLHWSIANAQGDKEAIEKAGKPDPKLLEQLFGGGGQDDPTLMMENMKLVTNPEVDLENKLIAMDNFEMLIENLDNANNIENLKLWESIIKVLSYEEAELRSIALSIVGTAVQNNSQSQDNFLGHEGGLAKIITLAQNTEEPLDVRTKAFYALSNLVRNHPHMTKAFIDLNGLDIIAPVLKDETSKPKLKMRSVALLTAVLTSTNIDATIVNVLRKDGIIESAIDNIAKDNDLNIIDRVLDFLSQMISARVTFTPEELGKLGNAYSDIESLKDRLNEDNYQTVKYVLK
ncbi:similar to Saccharomyces cerevisiae YBR101C FES1 Hsp70 (Ssa1p) nucleotide exchange factor [Maudiozyma barnettii]|mgnify:CR=1 FL=1|uniref:Hsp70 nucleotide exchange factor FES1 n=1 Tax=Maudiozyma barnettii TaxID=61262 RepID=A0A8H2VGP1_9SACH|nr:Fes1p [Kazachstania barnettii]CAB4255151.1 similar to Saccharomyces cerevisiae YBR101C FES1 Hsp70 (Ssa1p) nucleotide exchange factor [Kazachstania barnettii]CAD1783422.1 similar to Saccharomyces cerevisiae YBR101C FES1 Hsp70 (Ssa1p) nucleotide exchange factor [Kazachstania barnettii]